MCVCVLDCTSEKPPVCCINDVPFLPPSPVLGFLCLSRPPVPCFPRKLIPVHVLPSRSCVWNTPQCRWAFSKNLPPDLPESCFFGPRASTRYTVEALISNDEDVVKWQSDAFEFGVSNPYPGASGRAGDAGVLQRWRVGGWVGGWVGACGRVWLQRGCKALRCNL